jgi:hypothetical protein
MGSGNDRVSDGWRRRIGIYLACGLIILGLRIRGVHEPVDRDNATYAVVAHEMLAGRTLYSDLWDNKPPGLFWTFAGAELVLGYSELMVFTLGVLAAIATVPAIERAASALDPKAGLWAALLWSVGCNDLVLQGNQPNAESFMNLFTAWAFALLARQVQGTGGWRCIAAAGCLLAVASVYKQVIVFMCLPMALALAVQSKSWREAAILVASLGLPGVLAWMAIGGGFALTGTFEDFWLTVFVHSRHYSGSLTANLVESVSWGRVVSMSAMRVLILLALLTTLGLPGFRRDSAGGLRLLLAAWLVGTHIAVAAPGHFWPHYYQLWLPPLAVGAGWGVARLGRWVGRDRRMPAQIPGVIAAALLLAFESPLVRLDAEGYSRFKYESKFTSVRDLGRKLGRLLEPGESLYEWGPEPGLYFYSETRPLTGVLWDDPLFDSVISAGLSGRTLKSLMEGRPELVVVYTTDRNARVVHPILEWVKREYRPLPRTRPRGVRDPEFFVLKGGRLDRRASDLTWEVVMSGRAVPTTTIAGGR